MATFQFLQTHVEAVRQRDQEAEHPDDCDDAQAGRQLHSWLERVNDDEESIDGNGSKGEGGHVHAGPLGVGDGVAQGVAEYPLACNGRQGINGTRVHSVQRESGGNKPLYSPND